MLDTIPCVHSVGVGGRGRILDEALHNNHVENLVRKVTNLALPVGVQ